MLTNFYALSDMIPRQILINRLTKEAFSPCNSGNNEWDIQFSMYSNPILDGQ